MKHFISCLHKFRADILGQKAAFAQGFGEPGSFCHTQIFGSEGELSCSGSRMGWRREDEASMLLLNAP